MHFLSSLLLASTASASVSVYINDLPPMPLQANLSVTSAKDLFTKSCPEEVAAQNPYHPDLYMSSYVDFDAEDAQIFDQGTIYPSSASLVRGAIDAWAQHQHLVLRPDEVWFEVLVQMNYYMTTHAEDIRDLFVNFQGKEEIKVYATTWKAVIAAFSREIQTRVKTKWLLDWIMPAFSTSDQNDKMTATVLMMGLMQHYFAFSGGIVCGLPKVTLLGDKFDWERLLAKLDRLPEFGAEPKDFANKLRPIMSMFVKTFDSPEDDEVRMFWSQIVRAKRYMTCGGGGLEYTISGWITAFMHWKENGELRMPKNVEASLDKDPADEGVVELQGIRYYGIDMAEMVVGYAKAPIKMLDFPNPGEQTIAYVLAGNIGVNKTIEAPEPAAAPGTGTTDGTKKPVQYVRSQPMSSWFMYGPVDPKYKIRSPFGSRPELVSIVSVLRGQKSTCAANYIDGVPDDSE